MRETSRGESARLTAGCCAARLHARCVSRRRSRAGASRPAPSAQLLRGPPLPRPPPPPPPPNPTFPAPQPSCPTCGAPLREFTSDAVARTAPIAARPSPRAPRARRVPPPRRSRPRHDAALCADLFDVLLHRAKPSRAAANPRRTRRRRRVRARRPHLLVGARRADAKALEPPRRAALILAAVARTLLAPIRRRAWNPIARPALLAAAPAARHAWWLAETFVRSMHPGWTNPYERVSGAADASDGGGEIDRRHRRPPPRPADPGRGPHQFR